MEAETHEGGNRDRYKVTENDTKTDPAKYIDRGRHG